MTHSEQGLDLVAEFEGFSQNAYKDQGGVWTIGFGHTQGVKEGDTCTYAQARQWLSEDLGVADSAVNRAIKVPLTQYQFDALVSLTYNIGGGNFAGSTLAKVLNAGDSQAAATEFLRWNKVNGKENAGLSRRRKVEQTLFLSTKEGA